MMAQRVGVSRQTFRRVESGDPTVAMGTYLMAMFVLGLEWAGFERSVDPHTDDVGISLEIEKLPKTVRPKRAPQPK